MSRRQRQGLSPSLFPFLAVLVCTLGTLILFLALVAQKATDAAEQQVAQQRAAEESGSEKDKPALATADVRRMIAEEQFRVGELVAHRDQQAADAENRRVKIAHVDDHIRRLREQLKRLSDEVDAATGETETRAIDANTLAMLRREIDAEREVITELRQKVGDGTPRVVIVPHKGPNGTDRRPVYLECTADGLTIWPEGIVIPSSQLSDATPSANPLDAALRVIRYHALQHYGDSTPPYPLLVVRPGGIDTYAAARGAMVDWDDQFGYELVPAEVELAFNAPDPRLKQLVETAIRAASLKQTTRYAAGGGGSGSGSQRHFPTLSAAQLDRQAREKGYSSRDTRADASPYGSASASWSGPTGYGELHDPGSELSGAEAVQRLDAAADDLASNRGTRSNGTLGGEADSKPHHSPSNGRGDFDVAVSEATTGRIEQDSTAGSSLASNSAFNPSHGISADRITSADGITSADTATLANGATSADNTPLSDHDVSSPSNSGPADRQTAEDVAQSAEANRPQRSARQGERLEGARAHATGSARIDGGDQDAGQHKMSGAMSASGGQASNPSSQLQASPQTRSAESMNAVAPPSSDLVQRQGRDWALPDTVAGAKGTAIVRTIRAQCYFDRFVLLPSSSGESPAVFPLTNGDVNRATLQLATAVRDQVDRWGVSLPGGRWQPRLQVEVMPHGEQRFHQLQTLMNGSGVEVRSTSTNRGAGR